MNPDTEAWFSVGRELLDRALRRQGETLVKHRDRIQQHTRPGIKHKIAADPTPQGKLDLVIVLRVPQDDLRALNLMLDALGGVSEVLSQRADDRTLIQFGIEPPGPEAPAYPPEDRIA